MYGVMELVKSAAPIKINYGRWKEKDGDKFLPWECVAKCPLWSLEDYKAFRLMMGRPIRELSLVPPSSEKVTTIHLGTPTDDDSGGTDRVDSEGAAPDSGEVVAIGPRCNLRNPMHWPVFRQKTTRNIVQNTFFFILPIFTFP